MDINYKKNTLIFLTTVISLLVSVAVFNYKMDPAGMFRDSSYEYGIAKIMLSGKNVANLYDFDERLVQKYFIENTNVKPEIVVLGSSRVMQIVPTNNNKRFFNSGVSGASLEDLIAIYGLYRKRNIKPKMIIIGLDPWILNKNNEQSRWQSLQKEYNYEITQIGEQASADSNTNNIKKIKELVSMPYFLASLDKFKKHSKEPAKNKYYATDLTYTDVSIKRENGIIIYSKKDRDISLAKVNEIAKTEANSKDIYSLADFQKLSNTKLFECFIKELVRQNIRVVFFLPPYHPYVYSTICNNPKYRNVHEAEKYFHNVAKKMDIPITGSYNPNKMHLSENDFYDGKHLKETAFKKINFIVK